jgi:hypothetical protein
MHTRKGAPKKRFEEARHPLTVSHRRLPHCDRKVMKQGVKHLKNADGIEVSYKQNTESIVEAQEDSPYRTACDIMCLCHIPSPKAVKGHPRLFDAKYADYLWHTDLHRLTGFAHTAPEGHETLYIAALNDDRSRFIIHHDILTNKSADTLSSGDACAVASSILLRA